MLKGSPNKNHKPNFRQAQEACTITLPSNFYDKYKTHSLYVTYAKRGYLDE